MPNKANRRRMDGFFFSLYLLLSFLFGPTPSGPPHPFFTFAIRLVHLREREREKRSLTQLHLDIVCDSICLSISQTQSNQSVICQRLFFFLSSGGPEKLIHPHFPSPWRSVGRSRRKLKSEKKKKKERAVRKKYKTGKKIK
jgi:hypothetical protein